VPSLDIELGTSTLALYSMYIDLAPTTYFTSYEEWVLRENCLFKTRLCFQPEETIPEPIQRPKMCAELEVPTTIGAMREWPNKAVEFEK
jgi:hypothetical protein